MAGRTLEQELRLLACVDAHGDAITATLDRYGCPRFVEFQALLRGPGAAVEVLLAWLHRLTTDPDVRPLNAEPEVSWPNRPDPDDVVLVLALADDDACWYYEIRAAVRLVELLLDAGPAPASVVAGLLAIRARLEDDRLHSSEFFRAKLLPWVRQLVSRTSPPDVVDLGFLDPGDAWASAAAAVIAAAPDDAVTARAVQHMGSPRGGRASRAWWSTTRQLVDEVAGLDQTVVGLLDAVTNVDLTPRTEGHGWDVPDPFLLTPTNELVARGAAWAAQLLPVTDDLCAALGRVAVRSGAVVDGGDGSRMLCRKLAVVAVDTLGALDDPRSGEELRALLDTARSAVLVRRAGAALALPEAEVDAAVRRLRRR